MIFSLTKKEKTYLNTVKILRHELKWLINKQYFATGIP